MILFAYIKLRRYKIMTIIRPCADLRNNYNEISRICHETQKPVYITKNGATDLVILSDVAFEQYEHDRISKLVAEEVNKQFPDFESFKKDFDEKIAIAREQIKNGECLPPEEVFKELEAKYHLHG